MKASLQSNFFKVGSLLFLLLFTFTNLQAQACRAWAYVAAEVGSTNDFSPGEIHNFDLTTGNTTLVTNVDNCQGSPQLYFAGEFIDGKYYMIGESDKGLYEIDENGNCSFIGTVTGSGSGTIIALSHNPANGLTYLIDADFSPRSTLSTIDLNTAAATQIGNIPTNEVAISLPIDGQGNAFVISLDERIIPVNLNDASLAGPAVNITGISLNFAQDADFDCDDSSNTLYGTFFDDNTFSGKYGTLDPTTGVFTEIRDLGDQIIGFSIDNSSCKDELVELPAFKPYLTGLLALLVLSFTTGLIFFRGKV